VPLKNTVNTFFSHYVENRMDEILNDEENIIHVIHALQGRDFKIEREEFQKRYF